MSSHRSVTAFDGEEVFGKDGRARQSNDARRISGLCVDSRGWLKPSGHGGVPRTTR